MTRLAGARGPHGAVTCAQPSCRRELPGIWRMQAGYHLDDDPPWLFMAEGWHRRKDGTWCMTPRARRLGAFLSGRATDARRHFHAELTPSDLTAARGDVMGHAVTHLPALAICPFCGTPQQLDPQVLGVDETGTDLVLYAGLDERED